MQCSVHDVAAFSRVPAGANSRTRASSGGWDSDASSVGQSPGGSLELSGGVKAKGSTKGRSMRASTAFQELHDESSHLGSVLVE